MISQALRQLLCMGRGTNKVGDLLAQGFLAWRRCYHPSGQSDMSLSSDLFMLLPACSCPPTTVSAFSLTSEHSFSHRMSRVISFSKSEQIMQAHAAQGSPELDMKPRMGWNFGSSSPPLPSVWRLWDCSAMLRLCDAGGLNPGFPECQTRTRPTELNHCSVSY